MGDARELVIPEMLRTTAVQREGENARAWLERLPRIVAEMTDEWGLVVGPPLEGGNISWVAPATRRNDPSGAPLVLKVQVPSPESDPEAAALTVWGGTGAVRVHAHDAARCALLLERCEPGDQLGEDSDPEAAFEEGVRVAADLRRAAAAHPDALSAGRSVAGIASGWADLLEQRGCPADGKGPLDDVLWRLALDTLRGAVSPERSAEPVLLHGDLNPWNVLRSVRGWLAIDPKPLVGPPAMEVSRLVHQLAIPAGRDPSSTIADRLTRAAEVVGLDRDDAARWALVDAVTIASFTQATGTTDQAPHALDWARWLVPSLG